MRLQARRFAIRRASMQASCSEGGSAEYARGKTTTHSTACTWGGCAGDGGGKGGGSDMPCRSPPSSVGKRDSATPSAAPPPPVSHQSSIIKPHIVPAFCLIWSKPPRRPAHARGASTNHSSSPPPYRNPLVFPLLFLICCQSLTPPTLPLPPPSWWPGQGIQASSSPLFLDQLPPPSALRYLPLWAWHDVGSSCAITPSQTSPTTTPPPFTLLHTY